MEGQPDSGRRARPSPDLISVVAPAYNEEGVLGEFFTRVSKILEEAGQAYEIVFVNDGSTDGTLAELTELASASPQLSIVNLSRNFGKEIAMTAGIAHAAGDAIVVIDTDLQDPPELIPTFIEKYQEGYDMVYGRRTERKGETWMKVRTASMFYRLMRDVGPVALPENVGDFRLMSRRAVDALMSLPERHRFMKGLFAWIGYPAISVDYVRDPRFAGETKWNFPKLINLSIEGITSFTTLPLRLTTFIGIAVALIAFAYSFYFLFRTLIYGDQVQGFPTLIITILMLGGFQLIALGVIGEYLGRVFNETKHRPLYLVESAIWSAPAQERAKHTSLDHMKLGAGRDPALR